MTVSFGPYTLDPETGELWKNADPVRLGPQPTRILLVLVERAGRLVSREEIKQLLWDQETFVDFDQSLNACIRQIRSALKDNADKPAFVETLPRRGYRFIAEVKAPVEPDLPPIVHPTAQAESLPDKRPARELAAGEASASALTPQSALAGSLSAGSSSKAPGTETTRGIFLRMAGGVALMIVALGIGYLYYRSVHRARVQASTSISSPSIRARPSLAVLCFQNKSGGVQDAWISAALAEMLTSEMSTDDGFRVISSEDIVLSRKDLGIIGESGESTADLLRLRQSLGTDLFINGSYTVVHTGASPTIEVQVHVQDMTTGRERTTFVETGDLSNLYGIVNQSARHLRADLLAGQKANGADRPSPEGISSNQKAMRSYADGLDLYRSYDDQGARGLLELAIQADPSFAMAHTMLARVWRDLNYADRAEKEAAEAVRLSVDLPRVQKLSIEAFYHETKFEYDQAISIYRALWTFYPDDAEWGLMLAEAQDTSEQNQGADLGAYTTMEALRRLPLTPGQEAEVDWLEAEHFADTNQLEKNPETVKKARGLLAAAIQIARQQKSQLIMGTALRAQCAVLMTINAFEEGTQACAAARSIFEAAGNRSAVASETDNMAIAAQRRGDLKGAAEGFEEARKIFHETGSPHDEMAMASNIADLQRLLGNLDVEIKVSQDMIRASDTGGDPLYHWLGNWTMSGALLQRAQLAAATEAALESSRIVAQETPSKRKAEHDASSEALLGHLYLAAADPKNAERHFAHSLALRQKGGDPESLAESSLDQAALKLDQGQVTEADAASLHEAADLFAKTLDGLPYEMNAEVQLARVEIALGKPAEAAKAIAAATALHGKGDWVEIYLDLQLATAQVEEAQGKLSSALQTLSRQVDQAHSSGYVLREMQGQVALACLKQRTQPGSQTAVASNSLIQRAKQLGLKRLAADASHT